MKCKSDTENPFSLRSTMSVPPELQGVETRLIPFASKCSSQRIAMATSAIKQAIVIEGATSSRILTGAEAKLGQYEAEVPEAEDDIYVLAVIPKFKTHIGEDQIKSNPELFVIYENLRTHVVGYFQLTSHYKGSESFGFKKNWLNTHLLRKDAQVPKGTQFSKSPIKDGHFYKLGIEANILYKTNDVVAEDAFIISQSLADSLTSTAVEEYTIKLTSKDIPLDLYGDGEEIKFFPDIGDRVRDDGILTCLRKISGSPSILEFTENALKQPQYNYDSISLSKPGATVIDVDAWVKPAEMKKMNSPKRYEQVLKYHRQHNKFYHEIVKTYEELKKTFGMRFRISHEFNSLIAKAMSYLGASGEDYRFNKLKHIDGKEPVDFITIKITVEYPRRVNKGHKLTGADGGKGVIGDIWPDEDMPIDDFGIRADVIMAPNSVLNRLNPSQLYVCAINRMTHFVTERIKKIENTEDAYKYLITYIRKLAPNYANIIESKCVDSLSKEYLIDEIHKEGIYLVIPSYDNHITKELIYSMYLEYEIPISPVSFNIRDSEGNLIRRARTHKPMLIGSKGMMLLAKLPIEKAAGVGKVDQFGAPIKIKGTKKGASETVKTSTIRSGEDETRSLEAAATDKTQIARMLGIYGNSPRIVQKVQQYLYDVEQPSNIDRFPVTTQEVVDDNARIKSVIQCFAGMGIEMPIRLNTSKGE